ncbi:hypothetical protein C8T65DRAFT_646519 [Cerioporus squamosus]|nr:hypothetical protein C8T65DRAFT_646519 [Cerioporus squamosus]
MYYSATGETCIGPEDDLMIHELAWYTSSKLSDVQLSPFLHHSASYPTHNATPAPASTPRSATPTEPNAGIERGAAALFRPVPVPEAALVVPVPVPVPTLGLSTVATLVVVEPAGEVVKPGADEVPVREIPLLVVTIAVSEVVDSVTETSVPLEVGRMVFPEPLAVSVVAPTEDEKALSVVRVPVRRRAAWVSVGRRREQERSRYMSARERTTSFALANMVVMKTRTEERRTRSSGDTGSDSDVPYTPSQYMYAPCTLLPFACASIKGVSPPRLTAHDGTSSPCMLPNTELGAHEATPP